MSMLRGFGRLAHAVGGIVLLVVAGTSSGQAQQVQPPSTGAVVQIAGTGGDVLAAGATVSVAGSASSVDAAGIRVDLNATVSGQVRAAGALVTVNGSTEGDLDVLGGVVEVYGPIGGNASLGATAIRFAAKVGGGIEAGAIGIIIGRPTEIAGPLRAAAVNLSVTGTVGGPVALIGATVYFNGAAAGNVTIEGGRVTIGPDAVIGGDLVIRTLTPPTIDPAARVTGETVIQEPAIWSLLSSGTWKLLLATMTAAGTILAGTILIGVSRGGFEDALAHASRRPFSSLLIGILALVLFPIVGALLMATVIGLSFGLAILLLVPLLIVAGHTIVATCLGVWFLDWGRKPRTFVRLFFYLFFGAILLAATWFVPMAGAAILGLALLLGTGAGVRSAAGRLRWRRVVPLAPPRT